MKSNNTKNTAVSTISNIVIAFVLVSTLLVTVLAVAPWQTTTQETSAIYTGDEDSGRIALMFNVYENAEIALNIAKTLLEHGFRATFFVGGKWVERNGVALLSLYLM